MLFIKKIFILFIIMIGFGIASCGPKGGEEAPSSGSAPSTGGGGGMVVIPPDPGTIIIPPPLPAPTTGAPPVIENVTILNSPMTSTGFVMATVTVRYTPGKWITLNYSTLGVSNSAQSQTAQVDTNSLATFTGIQILYISTQSNGIYTVDFVASELTTPPISSNHILANFTVNKSTPTGGGGTTIPPAPTVSCATNLSTSFGITITGKFRETARSFQLNIYEILADGRIGTTLYSNNTVRGSGGEDLAVTIPVNLANMNRLYIGQSFLSVYSITADWKCSDGITEKKTDPPLYKGGDGIRFDNITFARPTAP